MTITIPTVEPVQITAGDYIQWQKSINNYPASQDWTLSYALLNAAAKYAITAAPQGDDYLVTITGATSAAYGAGVYQWQSYVTNGSQRITVNNGEMIINPNFAAQSSLETRSPAKQTLDALEAEIYARATGGMTQEYTIGNRSLKKSPITELIVLRDKYRSIYLSEQNAERIKNGTQGTNRVLVRI